MDMDDPTFYDDVAVLAEASRLDPTFERKLWEAATEQQTIALIEEGKQIIEQHAEQDFV